VALLKWPAISRALRSALVAAILMIRLGYFAPGATSVGHTRLQKSARKSLLMCCFGHDGKARQWRIRPCYEYSAELRRKGAMDPKWQEWRVLATMCKRPGRSGRFSRRYSSTDCLSQLPYLGIGLNPRQTALLADFGGVPRTSNSKK